MSIATHLPADCDQSNFSKKCIRSYIHVYIEFLVYLPRTLFIRPTEDFPMFVCSKMILGKFLPIFPSSHPPARLIDVPSALLRIEDDVVVDVIIFRRFLRPECLLRRNVRWMFEFRRLFDGASTSTHFIPRDGNIFNGWLIRVRKYDSCVENVYYIFDVVWCFAKEICTHTRA